MALKCCPKCRSENITDKSPNMWTSRYECNDCKAEWEMINRTPKGKIISCYADLI